MKVMQETEQIEVEEEKAEVVDLPEEETETSEEKVEKVKSEPKEEESGEEESADESQKSEDDDEETEDEEGLIVSFEGEEPPEKEEPAPNWVRELRKKNRELARENKKLQAQIQEVAEKKDQPIELGKKPTPEDFDYDAEATANAIVEWTERKRKLDEQAATKKEQEVKRQGTYQKKLEAYNEAKNSLKAKDYEDIEEAVRDALDVAKQSVIIQGAENPALVVYALGKNPQKLEQLSKISDPIQFAMQIARLESKMKVSTRKPPPPEKTIAGNASISASTEATLEKLEAEAERTGDRTKIIKYKQKLKNKTQ